MSTARYSAHIGSFPSLSFPALSLFLSPGERPETDVPAKASSHILVAFPPGTSFSPQGRRTESSLHLRNERSRGGGQSQA